MMNQGRQRILLVDDMPTNVRILGEALRHDREESIATSGEQALALAWGEPAPDLALLDIMMPGMDGCEVCRRLKDDPSARAVPVIDNYGHGAGDICLRRVARTLAGALVRPGDFPGRYGGEEFLALLPDSGPQAAREIAERLRRTVFDRALSHAYSAAADRVALSLGVAAIVSDERNETADLLKAADRALYRAKESGRNRVGASGED